MVGCSQLLSGCRHGNVGHCLVLFGCLHGCMRVVMSQHTPLSLTISILKLSTHDVITKTTEKRSLKRFCKIVCQYFLSRAVLQRKGLALDMIPHIEVANVQVFRLFCAGLSSIPFEKHGTHIVLIQHCFPNSHPLVLQELLCP